MRARVIFEAAFFLGLVVCLLVSTRADLVGDAWGTLIFANGFLAGRKFRNGR